MYGVLLFLTDRWVAFADDETIIINAALQPLMSIVRRFLSGVGQHEHPPLHDLLLHLWLVVTGADLRVLRTPSILFYLLGIWVAARSSAQLSGERAAATIVAIGILWPFGFHFGRLAGWYSLAFFLVSSITLLYLRFLAEPKYRRWIAICVLSYALVCTNYFGWFVLILLAVDLCRQNLKRPLIKWRTLVLSALLIVAAYAPIWAALLHRTEQGMSYRGSVLSEILNGGFSLYALFASESIGPWYWVLGVPIFLAVAYETQWLALRTPMPARRFFWFLLLLLAVMAILGLLLTKRMLLLGAWLLIPWGVALAQAVRERRLLPISAAAVILLGGWFGITSRQYYSSLRFVEPWRELSEEVMPSVEKGGAAISNNLTFLFHMAFLRGASARLLHGDIDFTEELPGVFLVGTWLRDHPISPDVWLIRGQSEPLQQAEMEQAEALLSSSCRVAETRQLLRDGAFELKQRLFPSAHQLEWRVRVIHYRCP